MWLKTATECKLSPSNRGTQLEHKERKQRKIAERNFAAKGNMLQRSKLNGRVTFVVLMAMTTWTILCFWTWRLVVYQISTKLYYYVLDVTPCSLPQKYQTTLLRFWTWWLVVYQISTKLHYYVLDVTPCSLPQKYQTTLLRFWTWRLVVYQISTKLQYYDFGRDAV